MLFKYDFFLKWKKSTHTYSKQRNYILFGMNVLSADKIAKNKRQLLIKLIFPTQRLFVNIKDYPDSAAGH